jgi:type IX secretion system PorP/SprF family membrane protein
MRRTRFILLLMLMSLQLMAQDTHFSQFYANPLYLAPSFAGANQNTRIIANYRDQWPSIPGHFVSYSFSGDHYFPKIKSGMGLIFFQDNAGNGKLVTTNIGFMYSHKVPIKRKVYFQPGLSVYYYSTSIGYSKLKFADQYTGGDIFDGPSTEVTSSEKIQHADFAISGIIYSENYWYGVNVNHLMTISSVLRNDYRYPDINLSVFGGVKITTIKRVKSEYSEFVHLSAHYTYESKYHQLSLGAYYFKNPAIVGVWYRGIPLANKYFNSDALIFLFGIKHKELLFSYSYDMTLGKLISRTGGSHEIAIIYNLSIMDNSKARKRYRMIPCPDL